MINDPNARTTNAAYRFLTARYEAADNYLWEGADGVYNVIAIFGEAEDCAKAAAALNEATVARLGEPRV